MKRTIAVIGALALFAASVIGQVTYRHVPLYWTTLPEPYAAIHVQTDTYPAHFEWHQIGGKGLDRWERLPVIIYADGTKRILGMTDKDKYTRWITR